MSEVDNDQAEGNVVRRESSYERSRTAPTPREVHVHDGEWCVACLAQGGRDALEFATRRELLDVEVLARAMFPDLWPDDDLWPDAMRNAREVAAEYARLADADRATSQRSPEE